MARPLRIKGGYTVGCVRLNWKRLDDRMRLQALRLN